MLIDSAADIQDVFYRQGMAFTILGPFMFALMTGYVFSREYQERTINQLFTYPISRGKILFGKLSVVFALIALTSALSCVGVTVIGFIKLAFGDAVMSAIWTGLRMNLLACVLSFGTVPVAAAVSMVGKNIIPSAILGAFALAVTLIGEIGHGFKVILFPWTTPFWPVRDLARNVAEVGANPYVGSALTVLVITFAASLIFCLAYYQKSEVHSGS
jgi:ABC-type transport system involved in multi-copper enzyme maturation permease subunit